MKIKQEKHVVKLMIELYCHKKEKNIQLCKICSELQTYAFERLDRCPFGNKKTSCQCCSIHCYRPEMRQKIREVMRFSGPRMLFYHPFVTLHYLFVKHISKKNASPQREPAFF